MVNVEISIFAIMHKFIEDDLFDSDLIDLFDSEIEIDSIKPLFIW